MRGGGGGGWGEKKAEEETQTADKEGSALLHDVRNFWLQETSKQKPSSCFGAISSPV